MTDQVEYTGVLSDISYRTTKQGRHWATANLTADSRVIELLIFPAPYEALRGEIREGVKATVSIRPPSSVTSMLVAGNQWAEPPADPQIIDTVQALFDDRPNRAEVAEAEAYLASREAR